jgi:hypothetical protein
MVVSLTGTVDSVPVIFTNTGNNLWETVVPPDLKDGCYIVELTATDDAGNQTYKIAELWVWQKVITYFKMIEQPYTHKLLSEKYTFHCKEKYLVTVKHHHFTCIDRGDKFCIRIS